MNRASHVTVLVALAAVWLAGCGTGGAGRSPQAQETSRSVVGQPPEPVGEGPLLVVLGDSLTAGLGLDPEQAYPALLQQRLLAAGLGLRVVNAGVSGDTSAGGLSRLAWVLEGDVRLLIVALGGNDALRALPVQQLRRNLDQIIVHATSREIPIILAGMEAPPNLGRDYTLEFRSVYDTLAKTHRLTLLPFLLEGVAGMERLNQPDGIHPTAEGARVIADHLWPLVEPMARKALARTPSGTPAG